MFLVKMLKCLRLKSSGLAAFVLAAYAIATYHPFVMGCCGDQPQTECENGDCPEGYANVTVRLNHPGIQQSSGHSEWKFRVIGPDGVACSGNFNSNSTDEPLKTFCAKREQQYTVIIEEETDNGQYDKADCCFGSYPDSSGTGIGGENSDNPLQVTSNCSNPSSGPAQLKFTWCSPCGSPGEKLFGVGSFPLVVTKNCDSTAGSACADLGSVDFRINLGNTWPNKEQATLLLHSDTIAGALLPDAVKFPSIIDVYELEIWHWASVLQETYRPEPENDLGYTLLTGSRFIYRFYGKDGYKGVFAKKKLAPVGRASGSHPFGPRITPSSQAGINHDQERKGLSGSDFSATYFAGGWETCEDYYANSVTVTPANVGPNRSGSIVTLDGKLAIGTEIGDADGSDGSLDDYVRAHFQASIPKAYGYRENLAYGCGFYSPPSPPHPSIHYNSEYIDTLTGGNSHFIEVVADTEAQKATTLGASYKVRNISHTLPNGAGTVPASVGGQVTVGPDVCIQVVPINATSYKINAFHRAETAIGSGGDVQLTGQPFAVWTVKPGSLLNSIEISEERASVFIQNWIWQQNGDDWTLIHTKGNQEETKSKIKLTDGWKTVRSIVDNGATPAATILYKEDLTDNKGRIKVSREGAANLDPLLNQQRETIYSYEDDGGNELADLDGDGKKLEMTSMRRSDGYFEVYKTITSERFGNVPIEATIRPWNGTQFNASLNISDGAVTLIRNVRSAAGDQELHYELLNDELMKEVTVTRTLRMMNSSTPQDAWLSYRLSNGNIPVERKVTATRMLASPNPQEFEIEIEESFIDGAPASLVGSLAYRKDRAGTVSVFHHYPAGSYDEVTDNFIQGQGQFRMTYEMQYDGKNNGLDPLVMVGDCYRRIFDSAGRSVSEAHLTWLDASSLGRIETVQYSYNSEGELCLKRRNGSVEYSRFPLANNPAVIVETDASGAKTEYSTFNDRKQAGTVVRKGFTETAGLKEIPDSTTSFTYDSLGRVTRTMTGTHATEYRYDSRGRIVEQLEGEIAGGINGTLGNVLTTTTRYEEGAFGRKEITLFPGNGSSRPVKVLELYPDGAIKGVSGTAVPIAYTKSRHGLGENPNPPFPATVTGGAYMERTVNSHGEVIQAKIVSGTEKVLADYIPSADASGTKSGSWRRYQYDGSGAIIAEYIGETQTRQFSESGGSRTITVLAAPNPNQTLVVQRSYVKDELGWWKCVKTAGEEVWERLTGIGTGRQGRTIKPWGEKTETISLSDGGGTTVTTSTSLTSEATLKSHIQTIHRGGLEQSSWRLGDFRESQYEYDAERRLIRTYGNDGVITEISYDSIFGKPASIVSSGLGNQGSVASSTETVTYHGPNSLSPGAIATTATDGATTFYSYYPSGEVKAIWGAAYPQLFTYKDGRVASLTTFRVPPQGEPQLGSSGDTTTWTFYGGLLVRKTDAIGQSVECEYDNRGRLALRKNARSITTSFSYDNADQLISKSYSDGTPPVAYTRNGWGQLTNVTCGTTSTLNVYGAIGAEPSDIWVGNAWIMRGAPGQERDFIGAEIQIPNAGGLVHNIAAIYSKNSEGEESSVYSWAELNGGPIPEYRDINTNYIHDPFTRNFRGFYHSVYPSSGGSPFTPAQLINYDGIGRLADIISGFPASIEPTSSSPMFFANPFSLTSFTYVNGKRIFAKSHSGDWTYGYNARGELEDARKQIAGKDLPGFHFGFHYDAAGNRVDATTATGGISSGDSRTSLFESNELSQLIQYTVPGVLQFRGKIGMNGAGSPESAQYRLLPNGAWIDARPSSGVFNSGYFGGEIPVDNTNGPSEVSLETRATVVTGSGTGEISLVKRGFLAARINAVSYDADGNLSTDGVFSYTWDAENRLRTVQVEAKINGSIPLAFEWSRCEFSYDWRGRRTGKKVFDRNGVLQKQTDFYYDDWILIAEHERWVAGSNSGRLVVRGYVWGPDLSGKRSGAGGTGGLQSVFIQDILPNSSGSFSKVLIPGYDGSGNIVCYYNPISGLMEQEEEYGPFGERLRPRLSSVTRCSIGWSSKYCDEETGLVYYGGRFYSPSLGRWINRDPIEESGGENLHRFVNNSPVDLFDSLGYSVYCMHEISDKTPGEKEKVEGYWEKVKTDHEKEKEKALEYLQKDKRNCEYAVRPFENNPDQDVLCTKDELIAYIKADVVEFRRAESKTLAGDLAVLTEYAAKAVNLWDRVGYAKHGTVRKVNKPNGAIGPARPVVMYSQDANGTPKFYPYDDVVTQVQAIKTKNGVPIMTAICKYIDDVAIDAGYTGVFAVEAFGGNPGTLRLGQSKDKKMPRYIWLPSEGVKQ